MLKVMTQADQVRRRIQIKRAAGVVLCFILVCPGSLLLLAGLGSLWWE